MGKFKLWKYDLLSGGSIESDKSGQTPQRAKFRKHFVNLDTAEVYQITDLESRKYKRNKYLDTFTAVYSKPFSLKLVSLLTFVVNEAEYTSISHFLNMLSKKLRRKNISKLGYVWVRDVGENRFEKHFHLMIALSRIDSKIFQELFSRKRHSEYEVQFFRNVKGLKSYLKKKNLYGARKQRAFGKSKEFKIAYKHALNVQ
jgi:hypothetical protein